MVGKMNSRWQSDNPVRSIGEYLPLRQRCTHAALTQRNTAPYVRGNTVILYIAQRHAYVPSGMRRAAYVYVDLCARARAHRDPVCRRDFAKREEVRTCTMHECVHIHTEPGLDLFPAELRDAWRRERNARGRAKRALRRDARIHGRRPSARTAEGLVKGAHIFDLCRGMCATSNRRDP